MSQVIAVANSKGGVAKTTTAVSLGAVLAQNGQDVLLVDLDAQANLTLSLGLELSKIRHSVADVFFKSTPIQNVGLQTSIPGLYLAPSNFEMEYAERFLPVRKNFEFILHQAVSGYLPYNTIIFDCPPSIGAVTTNALIAANLLIIPTQPEYFSVYALRKMLAVIRNIREKSNPNLIYRILITMLDRRNRIHRNLSEQLRITFNEGLFQNYVEIDTKLREASAVGLPITLYQPQSRSALQYSALAQELNQHVQKTVAQPAREFIGNMGS